MKNFSRISFITLIIACFIFVSFINGFAAAKKRYSVSPPEKIAKTWRIGYLEGGSWKDYQSNLIVIIKGLAELGWIEPIAIPPQENNEDTAKLWIWICANVKSKYLVFVEDARYSNNWDEEIRKNTKKILFKRLNEKRDIDLMIAMGTWAGQDLANNDHAVPTIIGSVTDAVAAKIIKSHEDSGYDHVHARVDPIRFERQIRAFHDIFGFKKLGVPFEDTVTGRSYAAIDKIEKVARERGFEIVPCYMAKGDENIKGEAKMIKCAAELALKTDAYYAPMYSSINPDNSSEIIAALNKYKIPSFSQHYDLVRHGFLISVAKTNFDGAGKFHAETVAQIFNGAKPRDLNQVYEGPVEIVFNAETAIKIGMKLELFKLLSDIAEEVYGK
ncbi:ABC transporter substrate binding protein [Desulfococcaceae bacterium HSG7]|nr:ABC transporter substrate binding protein [Desulfococcaceae bacterium HSG7]